MADAPSPTARLFLALWPHPETLTALEAWRDAAHWPQSAKPTASERMHLTVHFIGAAPRQRVPEIADALAGLCGLIEMNLCRAEVWPNRVAVLLPDSIPAALTELHGRLAGSLQKAGLAVDQRAYRPHVTLARNAQGAAFQKLPPVIWRSGGYVLAESRGGYHAIRRYGDDAVYSRSGI